MSTVNMDEHHKGLDKTVKCQELTFIIINRQNAKAGITKGKINSFTFVSMIARVNPVLD